MIWFQEEQFEDLVQRLQVRRLIHRRRTEHQDLAIFDNPLCGRVLALDGLIQTTERDEFVYHEMLAHPPLIAHGFATSVLIIGGGDGGALEEVLKHRTVERAVLVEIDTEVVELSQKHLREICGAAFEDSRTEVVVADGARYVAETDERFDLIIVDSPDPIGPAEVLFGEPFYAACKRALQPGGILVAQSGVPFVQGQQLRTSIERLRRHFEDATAYLAAVPTYNGGFMTLAWASDRLAHRHHRLDTLAERFSRAELATRYYNPEVHQACFALPSYIRDLVDAER